MIYEGKPAVRPPGSKCCLLCSWYFSTCLPAPCQGCGKLWGDTKHGGCLLAAGKCWREVGSLGEELGGAGGAVLCDCCSCPDRLETLSVTSTGLLSCSASPRGGMR